MAAAVATNCIQSCCCCWCKSDNGKLLHPELLMAARRGDGKRLKELLGLEKDDDDDDDVAATQDGGGGAVVVEVDRRHRPSSSSAAAAAAPYSPPLPLLGLDGVTTGGEGDSLLHVVAARGDNQEFLDCATMIHDKVSKGLLRACNNKGDTPLHCAARAGNACMISCLVGLITADAEATAAAAKVAFLRMQNKCGETALHQAIRAPEKKQVTCIDKLMAMDPDLAYIPHEEDTTSPLYLAISLGEDRIAQHLLDKTPGKLSYFGPDGRNVLHAAVSRQEALHMVLEWLKREQPTTATVDKQESQVVVGHRRLLSQLSNQRDKENGSTPLHVAASLSGLPSPNICYKRHPHAWLSAARLLLNANKSTAFQPDIVSGMYPIHVAAGSGSLSVMKTLLKKCPECATLRDAKGRTFLHVAVDEGRVQVVKYVTGDRERGGWWWQRRRMSPDDAQVISILLNAQDMNGDTALHRAVHAGNLTIFFKLFLDVRLDVTNNKGMTPIDVAWSEMPLKDYYAWDPRIHIRNCLIQVGAPYGKNRGDLFHQRYKLPKQDEDKISEKLTSAAQVLGLFSVLMTTVTFASAFTLPGGYRSAGDGGGGVAGTPVLAGSYAFDAFVLSNALAFLYSLFATSLLLYAGVPYGTLTDRFRTINLAYSIMWQAGRSLLAAFALGLYVTLFPVARTIVIVLLCLVIIASSGFFKIDEWGSTIFNARQ